MDDYGFLPKSYVKNDPLHASVFIANVGAFEADAGYHHLYEIGTIPMFIVLGKVRKIPVAEGDKVFARSCIPLKVTADERVVDGFYYYTALDYFRDQLLDPERLLEPAELVDK
jgi:pyruvate/2-oxoglutarate dehydrogenase complex dihydrolipoamide acyltransferase (E2) component